MEKQESDAAKRVVTEAHERNEDLLRRNEDLLKRNDDLIKKIEESGKIVTQLQEALQRYAHHSYQVMLYIAMNINRHF